MKVKEEKADSQISRLHQPWIVKQKTFCVMEDENGGNRGGVSFTLKTSNISLHQVVYVSCLLFFFRLLRSCDT